MESFISRFSEVIKGTISGFDRIVFKGYILPLMAAAQVMSFCRSRSILNKAMTANDRWILQPSVITFNNLKHF